MLKLPKNAGALDLKLPSQKSKVPNVNNREGGGKLVKKYLRVMPKYPLNRYSSSRLLTWYQCEALRYFRLRADIGRYPDDSPFSFYVASELIRIERFVSELSLMLQKRGYDPEYLQMEWCFAEEDVDYGE